MSPSHDAPPEADAGISLIEVIIALLVFAIISIGIITATVAIIRMTADNRSREFATNMAASDMDAVRAIANPFNVQSTTVSATDPSTGRVYTLTRVASWQSAGGTDVTCGTTTPLYSKRINDTVSWTGQLATTQNVRSDTLLAPVGRITTSGTGAISISATNAANVAVAGVGVTITPTSGGAALAHQPAATDSNGCSFATQVVPGTYTVTLSRAGYIDPTQASSAITQNVVVTAGGTAAVQSNYDAAASFNVAYSPSVATLPTNLATTFVPYAASTGVACVTSTPSSVVSLYPFASGYTGIAGATGTANTTPSCGAVAPGASTSCLAVDPAQWQAGGTLAAGVGGSAAAASPGGSANLSVRVGTLIVKSAGSLTAVSATDPAAPGDGNPGCNTTTTYTFGPVSAGTTIGLPFGSWTLYSGGTMIAAANIAPTNAASAVATSNGKVVVTLDPRIAK